MLLFLLAFIGYAQSLSVQYLYQTDFCVQESDIPPYTYICPVPLSTSFYYSNSISGGLPNAILRASFSKYPDSKISNPADWVMIPPSLPAIQGVTAQLVDTMKMYYIGNSCQLEPIDFTISLVNESNHIVAYDTAVGMSAKNGCSN